MCGTGLRVRGTIDIVAEDECWQAREELIERGD